MSQFTWSVDEPDGDGWVRMRLVGAITEASDFAPLLERAAPRVCIDLSGIARINSSGVREWIRFITNLCEGREVVLDRCAVPMVQQFNMIANMRGTAMVRSVMLPYFCTTCEDEQTVLMNVESGRAPEIPETRPCPGDRQACPAGKGEMEFDDLPDNYLAFLRT